MLKMELFQRRSRSNPEIQSKDVASCLIVKRAIASCVTRCRCLSVSFMAQSVRHWMESAAGARRVRCGFG
jgi:hypothetical protein